MSSQSVFTLFLHFTLASPSFYLRLLQTFKSTSRSSVFQHNYIRYINNIANNNNNITKSHVSLLYFNVLWTLILLYPRLWCDGGRWVECTLRYFLVCTAHSWDEFFWLNCLGKSRSQLASIIQFLEGKKNQTLISFFGSFFDRHPKTIKIGTKKIIEKYIQCAFIVIFGEFYCFFDVCCFSNVQSSTNTYT